MSLLQIPESLTVLCLPAGFLGASVAIVLVHAYAWPDLEAWRLGQSA